MGRRERAATHFLICSISNKNKELKILNFSKSTYCTRKFWGFLQKIIVLSLFQFISAPNGHAQCPVTCTSGTIDLNPVYSTGFSTGGGLVFFGDGFLSMNAGADGTVATISTGDALPSGLLDQLCLSADFTLTTNLDLSSFPIDLTFSIENICGSAPCPAIEFSSTPASAGAFSLGGLLNTGTNTGFDPTQAYQIVVFMDLNGATIPENASLSYSNLQLTACIPPIPGVDETVTICTPFESLAPATDRNNATTELSDGYLNNYLVPALPECTCGTATLENVTVNIDVNSINFPTALPAACSFFSLFGNVYVDSNPIPLSAAGSLQLDNEVLQGVCANSGQGSPTAGSYSLELLACGTIVNPGDYISVDIIPAVSFSGAPECATINGNAIAGNYVAVDFDICIEFNFECPDPPAAFIKN